MDNPGTFYDYGDGTNVFEAYVTGAVDGRRRPTVLLAHEWSGLNASMRSVADRVAAIGYTCFAMDVYGQGQRGDEQGDNQHLMNPLVADRALLRERLLTGLHAALNHPAVDPDRVAALGYCFGGLCVLDLARADAPGIKGVVSVHGGLRPPSDAVAGRISASVLVLHGWEDPMAPVDDVLTLTRELTMAGADWQLHAYGNAMHAFTAGGLNAPERGLAYNRNADVRAWRAMQEFFSEMIGTPET